MRDALLIHVADGAGPWWLATDAAGNGIGLPRRAALAEATPFGPGRTTVALVPGERVISLAARVPTRNRERLVPALAGALEDHLADDIEALHFAPGDGAGGEGVADGVPVAVVAHDALRGWLAELAAAGLDPRRVVPDYLALPHAPGQWHVLISGARVLARIGVARGFAATAGLAAAALTAQFATPPATLVIHAADDDVRAEELALVATTRGVAVERRALEPLGAERLLARGAEDAPLDLRQGPYRTQQALAAQLKRWRLPVALAAAWLAVLVLQAGIGWWRLAKEARQLEAALRAEYSQVLPADMHPDVARQTLEDRVAALRAGGGGARLLGELATLGAALAGTDAELVGLAYGAAGWDLKLRAGDIAALERARDRIATQLGREATLADAASDAGRVEGRLNVRGAQ